MEIGLCLLLKFKEEPARLGLTDLRYLLVADRIHFSEVEAFIDNVLKFKDVRQFFLQTMDAYQMMVFQLKYDGLTPK